MDSKFGYGCNVRSGFECCDATLGDHVTVYAGVTVRCRKLVVGDYTRICSGVVIDGDEVVLGHNCWVGAGTILNGTGGLVVCNNVGIGPQSQIWTHASWGDALWRTGCFSYSNGRVYIGSDACLSGHVIVCGPVHIGAWAWVGPGSVVTRDLVANKSYIGVPAREFQGRHQMNPDAGIEYATKRFEAMLVEYCTYRGWSEAEFGIYPYEGTVTTFNIPMRSYVKTGHQHEVDFMRWLQAAPRHVKFVPEKRTVEVLDESDDRPE